MPEPVVISGNTPDEPPHFLTQAGDARFIPAGHGSGPRTEEGKGPTILLESLEPRCLLRALLRISCQNSGIQPNPAGDLPFARGNVWFTEQSTNSIGMIDPADPIIRRRSARAIFGSIGNHHWSGWQRLVHRTPRRRDRISIPAIRRTRSRASATQSPAVPNGITSERNQMESVIWYTIRNNGDRIIDHQQPGSPLPR